jgi:uncharacterized protein YeaO (DUF488 family)
MTRQQDVRVRRVYEEPSPDDGKRILVDGLWPRGLSQGSAHVDEWIKAVAPSTGLRRWYGHEPARFAEFRRRYHDELREPGRAEALTHLTESARQGTLTLLTASRDVGHSQAAVLAEGLRHAMNDERRDDVNRDRDEDGPGDPACWMKRVCPACGALADTDPPAACPQCHAMIPGE